MTATMKAVRLHRYGGPEVLTFEDAPRPEPGDREVLVRVAAAGVNPIDCATRAGDLARIWPEDPFPAIVGWDLSGVVERVGASVSGFKPGDEVFALARFPAMAGAYAEYAAVPEADLALKPASQDHVHAAATPLAALTAWQALVETAQLSSGQTVLIHAAAGGVGHVAVQLAKWKGATVVATASARNEGFLKDLGADRVIDYASTDVGEAARDIDVQLDSLGGPPRQRLWRVMKPGGFLVSIKGPVSEAEAAENGVRAAAILVRPNAGQLAEIAALIDAGRLRIAIDAAYPLAQAARAHEHIEQRHTRGKVVLRVEH